MKGRKTICLLVFLFCLLLVPSGVNAYDYNVVTYNDNDFYKLQTFLNQPSAVEGKTNGQQLNAAYDANDPTTWTGVTWENGRVIGINWMSIHLKGDLDLSNFTEITYVKCKHNCINTINLSNDMNLKTLDCSYNQLNQIDVSTNQELQALDCSNNYLSILDVTNNINLNNLRCNNNQLTFMDVSKNILLTSLSFGGDKFTTIDLSKNTALKYIGCSGKQFSNLDISKNIKLETLICWFCNLTSLDLSNNTCLEYLYCYNSKLNSLDISKNINLTEVHCPYNILTSLDLSNNIKLEILDCSHNNLSGVLDLSNCINLVTLYCNHNFYLTGLDIKNCVKLYDLECYCDSLTAIDTSNCSNLKILWCSSNKLSSLDLSNNIKLEELLCDNNYNLTHLDISKNINLIKLYYSASITDSLDLSNNIALKQLNITKIKSLTANFFGTESTVTVNGNGYLSVNTSTFPNYDVKAEPRSISMHFENWTLDDTVVETSSSYTISSAISGELIANFSGNCNIYVIPNNSAYGTVTGGGAYDFDQIATVEAIPKPGYRFVHWVDAELSISPYSTNHIYSFTVNGDKHLKAVFAKISTPSISSAKSSGYDSITLKWNSVTGVDSYNVYRSASKTGKYSKIGTTESTSYKDTELTTGKYYYYKVKAACITGSTTTYSGSSSYKYTKPIPSKPAVTVSKNAYTSLKISWNVIDGATGYKIYRAISKTGTYSYIKTTTATSYMNTGLTTGKTYYYKVRAYKTVSGSNVYSYYSTYKYAKVAPSTPMLTAVSSGSDSIKLSWKEVGGATKYEVYRKKSGDDEYKLIKTTSAESYTDSSLITGVTYYYKVRAYHLEGKTKVFGSFAVASAAPMP